MFLSWFLRAPIVAVTPWPQYVSLECLRHSKQASCFSLSDFWMRVPWGIPFSSPFKPPKKGSLNKRHPPLQLQDALKEFQELLARNCLRRLAEIAWQGVYPTPSKSDASQQA